MKSKITFDHLNLTVDNFQNSKDWYEKIFNFKIVESGTEPDGREWGILKNGDQMLALYEYPNRQQYEGDKYHTLNHFSFRIRNRKEWEQIMKKHKLKTYYMSPFVYPNSLSWYIRDPSGYKIEISLWNNNKVTF